MNDTIKSIIKFFGYILSICLAALIVIPFALYWFSYSLSLVKIFPDNIFCTVLAGILWFIPFLLVPLGVVWLIMQACMKIEDW